MKNIEVEIRSFISNLEYQKLKKFFKENSKYIDSDDQVTYYYDTKQDLRIQLSKRRAKIWLKKGNLHDEAREELEVIVKRSDFNNLEKIFRAIGFKVKIKWLRRRHIFKWKGIDVFLDHTKGYGYIIELEKICSKKEQKETLIYLKDRLKELKIQLTPKKVFEKKV
ncbi:CYTH domain-containing protein [Candidatus Dojkabacteria bacterium]|nr:CYTH domain-containing protein [Candidatus Dojkabacteria bacterium]